MMKPDAQITCRRTPYGDVCEWKGGKVAECYGNVFEGRIKAGEVYDIGRLRVRVVAFPLLSSMGLACDTAAVMLESPHAQLYWLYREHAEKLIRLLANIETRIVAAYCGLRLRPAPEGKRLAFTAWVADRLL